MRSFQNKNIRNCCSADYTKQKYRLKRQTANTYQNTLSGQKLVQVNKQNTPIQRQSLQDTNVGIDVHRQQMKYLISENLEYFKSKIKTTGKLCPNQYKFKIPTKTPCTVYRKHFQLKQKNLSVDNLRLNRNHMSQVIMKKQTQDNFMLKSTYQNQYVQKMQKRNALDLNRNFSSINFNKQNREDESGFPRYMSTQNKCFLLNWGGRNTTTSQKPSYQPVCNNFTLSSKTMYKNDFQGKTVPPVKIVVPESSMSKLTGGFLVNKTSYSTQFTNKQKRHEMQKSCKPTTFPVKSCQKFKGSTQYRSQFGNSINNSQGIYQNITQNQLHTLILDL